MFFPKENTKIACNLPFYTAECFSKLHALQWSQNQAETILKHCFIFLFKH